MKHIIEALHSNSYPEKNAGIATLFITLAPDARLSYNEIPTRHFPRMTQLVHRSALSRLCHPHEVLSPLKETDRTEDKACFTITVMRIDEAPRAFTFTLIRNTAPSNPRAWLLSRIDYTIHNTS